MRTAVRRQRGNALVETAFSMTVFLMMIFGIMDFGRAMSAYNTLSYVTRAGVRYAVVRGSASGSPASPSDVSNIVKGQAIGLNPDILAVTTSWTPDKNPGSVVKVETSYNFTPLLPYMPSGLIVLKSTSQMVIAQ